MNSRLEYSRCRVPRLQIDKEPWLNRKKDGQVKIVNLLGEGSKAREVSEGVEEPEKDMNIPTAKPRDEIPEELRNRVEDEARRLEMKRKGTSERLRPKKKRKFEKLEGWGDPSVESEEKSEVVAMDVGPIEVEETIIDKKSKEPTKTKLKISAEVRRAKFKFKRKGKLREDEIKELRRTNINVFGWMAKRVEKPVEMVEERIMDDENDDALVKALEKEGDWKE